jgi:hypothetical protein
MRPLRTDITGTTDINGNASIVVKLPSTGEWHDLKISASTTGPAEWAILVSGTAITYGRGRRVTLGPELVQDGETVTLSITGGPISAPIMGSVTGKSGSPEEILATYSPQPNTIALDQSSIQQVLGVVTAPVPPGSNVGQDFAVPSGAQVIGFIVNFVAGGNPVTVKISGNQTGNTYLNVTDPAVLAGSPGPFTALIASLDTSVHVLVSPGSSTAVVDVLAFFTPINEILQQVPGTTFNVTEARNSWPGVADSGEPAAGVQASCTLASFVGGSRQWICREIDGQMGSSTAPAATVVRLRLRDGLTGVGAILRSWVLSVPAVAGQDSKISISDLAIIGTAGNAMTLEFSTGVANVFESCGFGADKL